MKQLKYSFFLLVFYSINISLYAQRIEATFHYGFIFPHRKGVNHLIKKHVKSIELNWFLDNYNPDKTWYYHYNFPEKGIGFLWQDFGNPEQLGQGIGVFPYWNFYFSPRSSHLLSFKTGAGIGWVTRPFREKTNYKNILVGSHVNALIHFALNYRIKIHRSCLITSGISFTHFSNGAYRMPNLGINVPAAKLGILWMIDNNIHYPVISPGEFVTHSFQDIMINMGIKEIYPLSRKKYPVFTLNINHNWAISRKTILSAGADIYYNTSYPAIFEKDSTLTVNQYVGIEPAVVLGYKKIFGETIFNFQTGFYLYTYIPRFLNMYQRISLQKKINEKMYIDLSLKSHFFVADYIGIGLGYNIKRK